MTTANDVVTAGAAAAALAVLSPRAYGRLLLSRAKHRSLAGHARLSRRVAGLVPALRYDEARFFRADDAPDAIVAARRAGFERLADLFAERFPESLALTAEARESLSDVQFTGSYRVPFQFGEIVRRRLGTGAFLASSAGVTVTDLDGNLLRPDRLLWRQPSRHRYLQAVHRRRRAAGRGARPGARPLSPSRRRQCRAAARDQRPRRGLLPHVRHRGGDAGGAPRALSHAAQQSRALLRRLPWLVG